MSKQMKRKPSANNPPAKQKTAPAASTKSRPSVFERLGTKADSVSAHASSASSSEVCLNWAQNGTCSYGKACKYSATHTLISPSKRLAVNTPGGAAKRKHPKEHVVRRLPAGAQSSDPQQQQHFDLDDADQDDLEKRRLELKRELDIQMKMEKAHKKQKKTKKESSPSSESSSSSSESSSSSDDSSSSSSSSVDARRKKVKKPKKHDSSSSSERELKNAKHKVKPVKKLKVPGKVDKPKKVVNKVKVPASSPTPVKPRKLSQTPPPKVKTLTPVKKVHSESRSPRPLSHGSDKKDRHRTPSPKRSEKAREQERERKERERAKERERDKDRPRDKAKKSPKREGRLPIKDPKRKGTPDSSHSRDRSKLSPRSASRAGTLPRREMHKSPPRRYDKRPDSRSKDRDRSKDIRKPSRERENDRERERRIAREERFAAREKEREEALARCQERQRERERLKKEEEARRAKERVRREDRGLDKPPSDRVERLLPLPQDRIPPAARKECIEKERHARDRVRRTPERTRSRSRKSLEKLDARHYERGVAPVERYDREPHDRSSAEYHMRIREEPRRDDKRYDAPYERPREDRHYIEMEHPRPHNHVHGHGHAYSDERISMDRPEYDERRSRREPVWDEREPELEHRRYREDSCPPVPAPIKPREWVDDEYDPEWERRRHMDWEGSREAWPDVRDREPPMVEEEWQRYSRSMDGGARRRWENENNWSRDSEPREPPREPRPDPHPRDLRNDLREMRSEHHRDMRNDQRELRNEQRDMRPEPRDMRRGEQRDMRGEPRDQRDLRVEYPREPRHEHPRDARPEHHHPRELRESRGDHPPARDYRCEPRGSREPRTSDRETSRARSTASQRERTAPPTGENRNSELSEVVLPENRKDVKPEQHSPRPASERNSGDRVTVERERNEKPERLDRTEKVVEKAAVEEESVEEQSEEPIVKPDEPSVNEKVSEEEDVPEPMEEDTKAKVEEDDEALSTSGKRPAEEPAEDETELKKQCIAVEEPLPDDLSEISDDADEILNRDEEIVEAAAVAESQEPDSVAKSEDTTQDAASTQPASGQYPAAVASSIPPHLIAHPVRSPNTPSISKDSIEENMNMDFEEISEDELEETARMKGLVDALGVDWASLVAESRPRIKPITSAKRRWDSYNVLVNSGVSVDLLGKERVACIFREHAEALAASEQNTENQRASSEAVKEEPEEEEKVEATVVKTEPQEEEVHLNGMDEELPAADAVKMEVDAPEKSAPNAAIDDINIPHPVAALQVVVRERAALRRTLFASAGPCRRALSARRDLAIRRSLCKLPAHDTYVEPAKSYDPELFKSACELFLQRSL